jgi:hypothetical protein
MPAVTGVVPFDSSRAGGCGEKAAMTRLRSPRRPAIPGGPAPLTRPAGVVGAALAAGCACLLAACAGPAARPGTQSQPGAQQLGGNHPAPKILPSTTPASAPSASPPSPPASASGSAFGSAPAPVAAGPVPACATSGLRVSIGAAENAAGSLYYALDFRNVTRAACTLYGFPGVSFVRRPGGGQVGGGAVRNPAAAAELVTVAPRAVAYAAVQVLVAQNYPASLCRPETVHWLRVYPPGQVTPQYASLTATTCTGAIPGGSTLGIYVVRPGATGP